MTCALTSKGQTSSWSFLRCWSLVIILNLAQIKSSISFLNWLINSSLTFWGLLPKLWISVGILITITAILSQSSVVMTLLEVPVLWPKCLNWPYLPPGIFFFSLCVYFASLREILSLILLAPNQSWKNVKAEILESLMSYWMNNLPAVGDGESKCKNKRDYQIQRWRRRKKRIPDNTEKYFWPYSLSCWIQSVVPLAF